MPLGVFCEHALHVDADVNAAFAKTAAGQSAAVQQRAPAAGEILASSSDATIMRTLVTGSAIAPSRMPSLISIVVVLSSLPAPRNIICYTGEACTLVRDELAG